MKSGNLKSTTAVYTAIFDNYDTLIDPNVVESDIDYICFTDDPELSSDIWEIRIVNPMTDPAMSNRRIKILAHEYLKDYHRSVYVDGNIQILKPIKPLVENYLSDFDLSVYTHPDRSSLFEEGDACIEHNKAKEKPVRDQMNHYRDAGFPDNDSLSENRILFRNHQRKDIQNLMWSWWREVSERVSRDQLSLMFVLWDQDAEYNLISHSVQDSPQFAIHPHCPDGYIRYIWPYWMLVRTEPDPNILYRVVLNIGKGLSVLKNEGLLRLIFRIISVVRSLSLTS